MNCTNMNYYDIECDDYTIATEAFAGIKSKIVSIFAKLVLLIEKKIKKMKDSKIKAVLLKLLSRAKAGLAKSKSLNERNPELARQLQEEAKDIQEEVSDIDEELQKEMDACDTTTDTPPIEKIFELTYNMVQDCLSYIKSVIASNRFKTKYSEYYQNGELVGFSPCFGKMRLGYALKFTTMQYTHSTWNHELIELSMDYINKKYSAEMRRYYLEIHCNEDLGDMDICMANYAYRYFYDRI